MGLMTIKYITPLLSSRLKGYIRKFIRKTKYFFLHKDKTSLEELRSVLVEDLGVKKGDRLFVTSGFASLNSNGYTPTDVIHLLQELVGEDGALMLPYYPPMNSTEWAKKGLIFDMNTTKSGMGVLTNVFKTMPGVVMSKHPTKAVCVWGKDAEYYAEGHECSTTPFYRDSPYGKFLMAGSKSLGLGVGNIPIMHAIEDILSTTPDAYHQKKKYDLKLVTKDGSKIDVLTYVHDPAILEKCISPHKYVTSIPDTPIKIKEFGYSFVYILDNTILLDLCRREFAIGNTRIKG